ncbi:cupredoxin domain-containing protein [Alicyclobacillus sp. ALC3]|uniref:cupredoxin domain-containing protein n=1 Tax=Alicyclobacillus sp. ALC3 TaxID=2796143 RepID=UPI002379B890|nr:cupredoxin domain-containing protein [Alicyclobacillus sp. ALC3]WDL98025.1 cupredoxin domain-containing protein [Alicyclobacillus sp. ALC3]
MSALRCGFALRVASALVGVTCALWSFVPAKVAYANVSLKITIRDEGIAPLAFSAKQGELVQIDVVNQGTRTHNLVIPAFYIFTQNLNPGEDVQASFRPDKTGRFPYYSDTGGKPEPGISGTMTVNP